MTLALRPGKESELTEKTEQAQAVAALLSRQRFSGVDFEVELRGGSLPRRPHSRDWQLAAPVAILWQAERPLAVLAGGVLTLARASPQPTRDALAAGGRRAGLKVMQRPESQLWSLMPSPRRAGASDAC